MKFLTLCAVWSNLKDRIVYNSPYSRIIYLLQIICLLLAKSYPPVGGAKSGIECGMLQ